MKNILNILLIICLLSLGQSKAISKSDWPQASQNKKNTTAANLIIFMTIPGIPGTFSSPTAMNTIEITDFSLSEENSISIGSITGGGGAGKATSPDFEFTVYLENAVVDFYKKMMKGEVIPEVKIFTYYPFNATFRKLEEINLKNVYVESIEAEATASSSAPVKHEVVFKFEAINKIGSSYSPEGVQTETPFTWNYRLNNNSY